MGKKQVYLVSDASGRTGRRVFQAALAQFDVESVEVHINSLVRSAEAVTRVVKKASERDAIIFFTIVDKSSQEALECEANKLGVKTVNILGPVVDGLTDFLGQEPQNIPGLLEELFKDTQ